MDECLEALHRLWSDGDASLDGAAIRFEGVDLRPLPAQRPRPPLWIGGRVDAVLRRVGRWGDAWFPSQASVEVMAAGRARLAELAEESGRPVPSLAVNLFVSVDSDRGAAREVVRDGLGHRFTDEATLFGATIAGSPADVVARIEAYRAVGCTAFDLKILPLDTGSTLRQVELLAREVLPALVA
jgi:alkanesulfonate monooxygenase SsuD/methylene tetrahydromethanopterin reductase-like flavin-dependent oxidoreductase (luciferase family)